MTADLAEWPTQAPNKTERTSYNYKVIFKRLGEEFLAFLVKFLFHICTNF